MEEEQEGRSEGSWLGKGYGGFPCLRAGMAPSVLGTFPGTERGNVAQKGRVRAGNSVGLRQLLPMDSLLP